MYILITYYTHVYQKKDVHVYMYILYKYVKNCVRDMAGYSTTVKDLNDEQVDQISARIMPKARSALRVLDLLPSLRKLKALTDTEYSHLRSGSLEQQELAVRLMEYLMYKGSYGLACLYLSLLTSSASSRGLPAHYQLARELKDIGENMYINFIEDNKLYHMCVHTCINVCPCECA